MTNLRKNRLRKTVLICSVFGAFATATMGVNLEKPWLYIVSLAWLLTLLIGNVIDL